MSKYASGQSSVVANRNVEFFDSLNLGSKTEKDKPKKKSKSKKKAS